VGTNFYVKRKLHNHCDRCGRPEEFEEVHVGKRSFGWQWLFNPKFDNAKSWVKYLTNCQDSLFDEYDEQITLIEMIDNVNIKGLNGKNASPMQYGPYGWEDHEFFDDQGYRFSMSNDFC